MAVSLWFGGGRRASEKKLVYPLEKGYMAVVKIIYSYSK